VPVLPADWVTAADGTGCRALAPAYGENDHELCRRAWRDRREPGALPTVRSDASVAELAGSTCSGGERAVMRMLAAPRPAVSRARSVAHKYPHCWPAIGR